MRSLHVLLFYLAFPLLLIARQQPPPVFKVISLPAKLNYNKDRLTGELSKASSKDDVRSVIRAKHFPPSKIVFKIVFSPDNFYWWTLNTGDKKEMEDDHIILQSRNSASLNFYTLSDFKTLFRDTLVLFDTLAVKLSLHDEAYPDDKFMFNNRLVPLAGETLLITPRLIEGFNTVTITNGGNPERQLAHCRIHFLSREEKEEMRALLKDLKDSQTRLTMTEKAALLATYIAKSYGSVYFPQLILFMELNEPS